MSRDRRGFTLVEAMTALLITSTLARIALPNFQEMKLKAQATEIVGAIRQVEVAAMNYNADTHQWPDDTWPGEVPPELADELEGVSFDRQGYQLDWENWRLPDGLPKHPETRVLLGVSITSENEDLGNAIVELVGESRAHFTLGDNYTFVLEGM